MGARGEGGELIRAYFLQPSLHSLPGCQGGESEIIAKGADHMC